MDRRTLLTRIVQAFTVVGTGFLAWPFLRSLVPDPEPERLEVDLAGLRPGEARRVTFRGRPVSITRRVEFAPDPAIGLKDPDSAVSVQPAFARTPHRSLREEYLVVFASCTHLGCEVSRSDAPGIGFECPCHESRFDVSGRVLEGAVALYNLEVPNYRFLSRYILELSV